jgi:antigen flippase
MGGAAGITLLLGMIRTKFVAVLIGTTGVGLLASFTVMQGIIGTIAGLGIQSSAVRDVTVAIGKGDEQAIGCAVLTLRRMCWLTGLVGMATMIAFSSILSQLTFGSDQYQADIAALGVVILLINISGGQLALIQGMRRIGDMALANIIGAMFATLAAIGFYFWLGVRGIVPALISIAAMQLVVSWYFARRVPIPQVKLSLRETFTEASGMVRLGLVFMWTGLMGSAVTYITITLIVKQIGLQGVGIYSAAFALSGVFVGFVLGAMAADYYPRLTALAHDKTAMRQLVNEQTEIGLLVATPGLLATLAFAPWAIHIFYSAEFLPAVELLQWFVLGCLGRVISWPLGYLILALGKGRWFLLTESAANLLHVLLLALGLFFFGIEGVAIGFFLLYIAYVIAVYLVGHHLIGFEWSPACIKTVIFALPLLGGAFIASRVLPLWPAAFIGMVLTAASSVFSLLRLIERLGHEHRIFHVFTKWPIINKIIKLKLFNN